MGKIEFRALILGVLFLLVAGVPCLTMAQPMGSGFWVEFVDGDENGEVVFNYIFTNADSQTYWTGIASPDHNWVSDPVEVGGEEWVSGSITLPQGIYDVYVAWDSDDPDSEPDVYIWTSQAGKASYAINNSDPSPTLSIAWQEVNFSQFQYSFTGDGFRVHAVPLPGAAGIFALGLYGLGMLRRKRIFSP